MRRRQSLITSKNFDSNGWEVSIIYRSICGAKKAFSSDVDMCVRAPLRKRRAIERNATTHRMYSTDDALRETTRSNCPRPEHTCIQRMHHNRRRALKLSPSGALKPLSSHFSPSVGVWPFYKTVPLGIYRLCVCMYVYLVVISSQNILFSSSNYLS